MFKTLKSLLSYSRVPIRIAAKSPHIYRVRFVPPPKNFELKFRYTLPVLAVFSILGWAGTSGLLAESPLFIPLGPARQEPMRRYGKTDPETRSYQEFSRDRKRMVAARTLLLDKLVKYFEATNRDRIGGNIHSSAAILYFGYPVGPPPAYRRSGLLLSADKSKLGEPDPQQLMPYAFTHVKYTWTTQPVDETTIHRLSRLLYPYLMFNSLYASLRHSFSWFTANVKSSAIESLEGAISMGQDAIMEGLDVMKNEYRKGWQPPPPPRGHVLIYGLVEIIGDNLIVGVDVTASFDPETMGNMKFLKMDVRFVGRIHKKPVAPKPPPIVIPQTRDITTQVISGLKADIAAMSAAAMEKEVKVKKEELGEKQNVEGERDAKQKEKEELREKETLEKTEPLEGKEQHEGVIEETQEVYDSRPKDDERGSVRGGVDESTSSSSK